MTTGSNQKFVVGVFRNRMDADSCFNELLLRGFNPSDVNVMMTDQTRERDYAWDQFSPSHAVDIDTNDEEGTTVTRRVGRNSGSAAGSMAAQGVGVGGSIGTAVGATVAAIAAVGTSLVIPGLNLIVAGPIVAALAGGGAGAIAGGLVGGLVGLGIPEQDAQVYNKALQLGGVVMSVEVADADVQEIVDLMIDHSGEQVICCN